MLRLSKKADYALLAMRHLAAHSAREVVSTREVAEACAAEWTAGVVPVVVDVDGNEVVVALGVSPARTAPAVVAHPGPTRLASSARSAISGSSSGHSR